MRGRHWGRKDEGDDEFEKGLRESATILGDAVAWEHLPLTALTVVTRLCGGLFSTTSAR